MIRGIGETGSNLPGEIPWLTLDTTSGTLAKDGGEMQVLGTFDSAGLELGSYFANCASPTNPTQESLYRCNSALWTLSTPYICP